jgi:hypothetical protein
MIGTKVVLCSFLLPLFSFTTILLILSSIGAATVEATTNAQLLPKAKTGNNNNVTRLPLPAIQTKQYIVKIISPIKGQQILVHSNLTVTGVSFANSTSVTCQVSVIVNGIKPYQKAVPTGHGGKDYTTWKYRLTPAYAAIKKGQNKITAKFSCGNNPSLLSHNSVNVTGVDNSNPAIIVPSSQHVLLPSNNNSKLLLISVVLAKNPVSIGGKETLKTTVLDASNSSFTIAGARVNGTVTDSTNTTITNFNGTTDNSGMFTYTWKVKKDSKPGIFTVGIHAAASGYQSQSTPTRTTFNVIHKISASSPTHHAHKSTSGIYGHRPLSIIRIPHIPFPHIHFPNIPSFY